MTKQLKTELDTLNAQILDLGDNVATQLKRAVLAVMNRDARLAEQVINFDHGIDRRELEIEDKGLRILALQQPVAVDLRFIASVLRINNDLERIGDIAVNLSYGAQDLAQHNYNGSMPELGELARAVLNMVNEALRALNERSIARAEQVRQEEHNIDQLYLTIKDSISGWIQDDPKYTSCMLSIL